MTESTRVDLTINGRSLSVKKGTTILQAARLNHIPIPTLCDFSPLPSHGSCRLCIVEVEGRQVTPTACTTPVEDGMVVFTHTPKVQSLRAEILQMLFSEHPSCCLFCEEKATCEECMVTVRKAGVTIGCRSCPKDRQCELQTLAESFGLKQVDYPVRYRMLAPRKDDPFVDRDYNLCVLCGRCIRACKALHPSSILGYFNRGPEIVVGTAFGQSHLQAGCSFCGACLDVCPTGALSEKTRKWDGRPDKETETTCPLCSLGCTVRLFTKNGQVIGSAPLQDRIGSEILCVEGRFGFAELLNHPGRLKRPQVASGQRMLNTGWDEAIRLAAEKLAACPPDKFEMVVSASCSNEDLYLAQKFTRVAMRSAHIRTAAARTYGSGFNTVCELLTDSQPLAKIHESSTILCLGLDGRYAQSVVATGLHQAKLRGSRVITVFPGPHGLAEAADLWLQPVPGEELALLERLAALTGEIARTDRVGSLEAGDAEIDAKVCQAAQLLREPGETAVIVGPDLLSHRDNRRILAAVQTLVKNIGASLIPLPAEGNLVGSLFMGAGPELLPGGRPAAEPVRRENPGHQVMYLLGEMPPHLDPRPEFIIYQNIYPPAAGCEADLYLPAAAFSEADGTTITYQGRVQPFRAAAPAPGEALPSWEILCRLARAMGAAGFDFSSVEAVQAEIATLVSGFEPGGLVDRSLLAPAFEDQAGGSPGGEPASEHIYLGFPLSTWVEGLRLLVPGEINHVPNR